MKRGIFIEYWGKERRNERIVEVKKPSVVLIE